MTLLPHSLRMLVPTAPDAPTLRPRGRHATRLADRMRAAMLPQSRLLPPVPAAARGVRTTAPRPRHVGAHRHDTATRVAA